MTVRQIGDATLYLGDARSFPLLDGCADMIFTDPPYGHNNNDGDLISQIEKAIPARRKRGDDGTMVYHARPIANDGPKEATELADWLFREAPRLLAKGGCCCCCCCGGGGGPDPMFARWSLMMNDHLLFKQMIVWDKGPMGMGWHYRRSYETVLVGQKRGGPCKWYDESGAVENIIRPGRVPKIIPRADQHPTEKSPKLAADFIRYHTLPGETVLDPFMGSGSTGVAALSLGRKFIGIEIDPHWYEVACQRIAAIAHLPLVAEPVAAKQIEML